MLSFCKGEKDTVWNGDFIGSIEKEKRFAIEQTRLRIFGQARKKQADFDLWDFYFWLSANTAVPVVESHKSTDFDPLAAIKYPKKMLINYHLVLEKRDTPENLSRTI